MLFISVNYSDRLSHALKHCQALALCRDYVSALIDLISCADNGEAVRSGALIFGDPSV